MLEYETPDMSTVLWISDIAASASAAPKWTLSVNVLEQAVDLSPVAFPLDCIILQARVTRDIEVDPDISIQRCLARVGQLGVVAKEQLGHDGSVHLVYPGQKDWNQMSSDA